MKLPHLFFQIVEHSPSQITFIDLQGTLIYANKAARDFFCVSADALPFSEPDPEFAQIRAAHPEDSAKKVLEIGIPTVLKTGYWRSEHEAWRPGNPRRAVPVEQVLVAHRDEATGEITHISSTLRDLSQEKMAISKTQKLMATLEVTSDLVGLSTIDGKIEYHNRSWDNYGTRLRSEGATRSDFHPAWAMKMLAETAIPSAIKDGVWQGESAVFSKLGGEIPVSQVIVCHYDKEKNPTHLSTIIRDMSELKESHAKLLLSSKMVALGEMSSGIAHEINNPLSIIVGRASQIKNLLSGDNIDKSKITELLEKIEATALRISKIIRGLKNFSRSGDEDPFVPTPLRQIIEDTLGLAQERFKNHGVELRLEDVPDVTLSCRSIQLTQVMLNLLNNAFDAVSNLPTKWVQLSYQLKAEGLEICVTDSGQGISEVIAQKMMMPFFTTKEVGKGTGLGLSISKGIIEAHGGSFQLNAKSQNTQFVVYIPFKKAAAHAA